MNELNKELIVRKLEVLLDYLEKLKEYQSMNEEQYLADYHHYGLAEHLIQLAIEQVLDIGRIIIADLNLRLPDDAHDIFKVLAKAKILTPEFAERNAPMVGLRNRLVHEYADINHRKTYQAIQNDFKELTEFINAIRKLLANSEASTG